MSGLQIEDICRADAPFEMELLGAYRDLTPEQQPMFMALIEAMIRKRGVREAGA